ncbi:unnamed protein product [Brugia pahangi]|uniref:Secreted protein n=1 Tax=Brugia pahangi TaxID=6280 RepID=A0A0N4TRU8_BRUPA|nr:unnamed protein product [Brugia pahangi]
MLRLIVAVVSLLKFKPVAEKMLSEATFQVSVARMELCGVEKGVAISAAVTALCFEQRQDGYSG